MIYHYYANDDFVRYEQSATDVPITRQLCGAMILKAISECADGEAPFEIVIAADALHMLTHWLLTAPFLKWKVIPAITSPEPHDAIVLNLGKNNVVIHYRRCHVVDAKHLGVSS